MADTTLRQVDIQDNSVLDVLMKDIGSSQYAPFVVTPGGDTVNAVQKSQPKSAVGSGGRITANGILHTGTCTLLGINVQCTTAGTIDIAAGVAGGGTSLFTLTGVANQSYFVPLPGVAFAAGIYATLTTFTGSITAFVGPAVQ